MNKNIICYLPLLLVFFGAGYLIGFRRAAVSTTIASGTNQNTDSKEVRLKENYKFINPLLECDSGTSNLVSAKKLNAQIQALILQSTNDKKISTAGVYFRDLNNGPWFGINQDALFSPASLLKVPLMLAYYKLAESDPNLLNNKIINEGVDIASAYGNVNYAPSVRLEIGKEYTVDELITQMITNSDNVAYILLDRTIDNNAKIKIYDDLGVNISAASVTPDGNIISIRDYSSFFRILYNASYLSRALSEKALNLLSQSIFKDGLVAELPSDVTVAHKFGERFYEDTGEKQLHDCGVVYAGSNPYLLCVMTRGDDYKKLSEVISQISASVYNFIATQKLDSK